MLREREKGKRDVDGKIVGEKRETGKTERKPRVTEGPPKKERGDNQGKTLDEIGDRQKEKQSTIRGA